MINNFDFVMALKKSRTFTLSDLKSKDELIAEIIMLLQSPAKNIISSLKSGSIQLSGIVNSLSERVKDNTVEEDGSTTDKKE